MFKNTDSLSDDERKVYLSVSSEPQHIDVIAEKCGLPSYVLIRAISSLELKDFIVNTSGRLYAIK